MRGAGKPHTWAGPVNWEASAEQVTGTLTGCAESRETGTPGQHPAPGGRPIGGWPPSNRQPQPCGRGEAPPTHTWRGLIFSSQPPRPAVTGRPSRAGPSGPGDLATLARRPSRRPSHAGPGDPSAPGPATGPPPAGRPRHPGPGNPPTRPGDPSAPGRDSWCGAKACPVALRPAARHPGGQELPDTSGPARPVDQCVDTAVDSRRSRGITPGFLWISCGQEKNLEIHGRELLCPAGPAG
jgi:hypothetical protein